MSAYVVNQGHIDALLRAALAGAVHGNHLAWYATPFATIAEAQEAYRKLDSTTATRVGQMLVTENVASVCHRYRETPESPDLPGPVTQYWLWPYTYPVLEGRDVTPVEALKLLDGTEYQSCEHPTWEASEAYRFCQALRKHLITQLPGYEEAAWSWGE